MSFSTALSRSIAVDAVPGAVLLAAIVALPCLLIASVDSGPVVLTATNFLVMLVAVLGISVFSGNSGIISFGNVAFMAIGAQVSATLTLPTGDQDRQSAAAARLHSRPCSSISGAPPLVALVIVAIVALISGLALVRMSPDFGLDRHARLPDHRQFDHHRRARLHPRKPGDVRHTETRQAADRRLPRRRRDRGGAALPRFRRRSETASRARQ